MNVAYSYAIIGEAALDVQKRENWQRDGQIRALHFSHKWINSFTKRGGLSRRKITRDDKVIPSDEEIQYIMGKGQDMYFKNEHTPSTTYNFDETAFTWAIGPTHIFCPKNQQRATNIGISNTKMRITAVVAVNAIGEFAPLMLIVKHTVSSEKKPDQSTMQVIHQLHKKPGFTEMNGWEKKTWIKTLTINGIEAEHKVVYIVHNQTGHVITSQCKAWNDTVRMIVWFEVVMKPIKDRLGRMLLWNDNCSSHKTTIVKSIISAIGIDVAYLPPNMTSELQVLDLAVNGPLKAHIRKNRANRLYTSFQTFKRKSDENIKLPKNQRKYEEFQPPKPTMLEGINDLIALFGNEFKNPYFQDSINRSFIATNTLPKADDDVTLPHEFSTNTKVQKYGTMLIIPTGTYDADDIEDNENDPEIDDIEMNILDYYVQNHEMFDGNIDENQSDDDDVDNDEGNN